ncbi:phosphoadenosine phosphosulfate reductase [Rhodobacteraceae bacterium D3-12]|nr:phosphoadenosine phosphosulfate reductase [Rhodobacteraceae bacterium D3-12]
MQDTPYELEIDLSGLAKAEWLTRLADTGEAHGHFQPLGQRHFAAFLDAGSTLLVSFETIQGMRALTESAEPLGWSMTRSRGWSSLTLVSQGDTWFRDRDVFGYFDALIDDGFFDEFDRILFYGAGPCGYAAAAFSVAAPGAEVLAIQPQATLDPRIAEWDDRFTHMRRTRFDDRYGYAPDMLDAATNVFILYDPSVELDAMHTALFTRPNVEKFRMRFMGAAIQTDLIQMKLLAPLLALFGDGALTTESFARLMRARRTHPPYLRRVLAEVDKQDRPALATMLCRNVVSRLDNAPRFSRRLNQLLRAANAGDTAANPPKPDTPAKF